MKIKSAILCTIIYSSLYCTTDSFLDAVARNDNKLILYMIKNNADVNITNDMGMTPLHLVKDLKIAQLLIKNGADLNKPNKAGTVPLHWSVSQNQLEITKLLIEYGAEINVLNNKKNSPLHIAAQENNLPIIELLIKNNADINITNLQGFTPFDQAKFYNYQEASMMLSKAGATIILNSSNTDNNISLIDQLEKEIPLEVLKTEKKSPIFYAMIHEHYQQAQDIINSDTNALKTKDQNGDTPLHWAVRSKNRFIIRLMLSKDADYTTTNAQNKSALDLVNETYDKNFIDYVQTLLKNKTNFAKGIDK
ncbi:MAG: ankyrin repeat domain-containing protein [Brevinemataceae bacterium]